MSERTAEEMHASSLLTAADVANRVGALIGKAMTRKLWLLLRDGERRQFPILMPIVASRCWRPGRRWPVAAGGPGRAHSEGADVLDRPGGPRLTAADQGRLQLVPAGLIAAGLGSARMVPNSTKGARSIAGKELT